VHHVFLDVPLVPEKGERGDHGVDMTLPEDLGQLSAGGKVDRLRNERVPNRSRRGSERLEGFYKIRVVLRRSLASR
jgi:hypothetical protein